MSLCFHKSGMSGTKIADRLGFSRHMKTRLNNVPEVVNSNRNGLSLVSI